MIRFYHADGALLCECNYSGDSPTVSSLLKENGLDMAFPCAENGRCGKCRVRASGALTPPTGAELRHLTAAELKDGVRLACEARVCGDAAVRLLQASRMSVETGQRLLSVPWDVDATGLGLSVDIGTTTVAACLWDRTARVMLGVQAEKNPQAQFGADVISRLDASMHGDGERLARLVTGCIARLAARLCGESGRTEAQVEAAVITGNTAMLYLLCGLDVREIAVAPFVAGRLFGDVLSARELGFCWHPDCRVYLPPCLSAYVGADITCGLLASELVEREQPALFLDIGTNGEMVLCAGDRLLCCATAAGPAFEGVGIACGGAALEGAVDRVSLTDGVLDAHVIGDNKAASICGSGLLDAVCCLLQQGVIDETGRMHADGGRFSLTEDVYLCQQDVRALQLAKGAVRAGAETLLHTAGLTADMLRRVCLAGGFGSKLSLHSAAGIGLLPDVFGDRAEALGNTALAGASLLLRSTDARERLEALRLRAETVELTASPVFADKFMEHMSFEEE